MTARSRDGLEDLAAQLHNRPVVLEADLFDPEAPQALATAATEALGPVDLLVNNAAFAARLPIEKTDAELIDRLCAINVRAPLLLIAALVPGMTQRGRGAIINISSASALVGTPRRAAYAASKGALDAAMRSLAIDLGPHGIRVNSVAPGVVDTDLMGEEQGDPRGRGADRGAHTAATLVATRGRRRCGAVPGE